MLYFPLSPRTSHIRLLVLYPGNFDDQISCGLVHHDLDRSRLQKFEALSYTWGDASHSSSILLKGQGFRVTKNLEAALRNLRPLLRTGDDVGTNNSYLWVDAICINQQDLRERSEQVLQMPKIYQAAATTIVWLGEVSDQQNLQNVNTPYKFVIDHIVFHSTRRHGRKRQGHELHESER